MKNYRSLFFSLFCLILITGILFISSTTKSVTETNAVDIVKEMFAKSKQITSMTYVMKKEERIEGKMIMQQSFTKLVANPLKVYLRQELPKKGLEVLYVHGSNNNNALVNTNGFPWVNLNLDPMGGIMRENQHHTIYESGYPHLISILEHLMNKYNADLDKMVTNEGTVNWGGRSCWSIAFNNPNFKYNKYTVKAGETVLTISERSKLSEYMILEINKEIDDYKDVKAGQVINVPNDYSPKMELYIDKQLMIPIVIKVYDDKGLYEHYQYHNVVINPGFKPNEFEKSYPEYHF